MNNSTSPSKIKTPFISQTLRLAGNYWKSEGKWKIRAYSAALFLLTVAQVGLAIWMNYWNRELFDALGQHSSSGFFSQIGIFVVIFSLMMLVTAAHLHVKRWLQIDWRRWMTDRVVNKWLCYGAHYQLSITAGDHDNPDGRIADDIRIVTESVIAMAHTLVYSILIFGTFIDILYSLSGSMRIPGTSLVIPAYMVIMAFAYASIGTLLGWWIGKPLTQSTNQLQTAEANFRFGLASVRENSEAIAMSRGEPLELKKTLRLFTDVSLNWTRQTMAYTWLVSYGTGYGALLPVFPILIAAPQYIAGTMTLGVLMQASLAFQKLTSALSWPVDNIGEIARCRASVNRIITIYDDLLSLEKNNALPDAQRITIEHAATRQLIFENLFLTDENGLILLENFNYTINRGDHLLISGDAFIATSLFKAIAGVWPWGQGKILLPVDQKIVFMSQQPQLPHGTLRAALSYPNTVDQFELPAIEHALECAGLLWLAPRLDEEADWNHVLPLHTQQRLGFARLKLQNPCWIIIDETTNTFDAKGEFCIMDMLQHELPSATFITISISKSLEKNHERKLVLNRMSEKKYLFTNK